MFNICSAREENMTDFKAKQSTRQHTQHFGAAPERVFPLLCPTREYEWIEPWECELLRSDSGFAEANCVFRTGVLTDGVEDVWVVSHYEPSKRIDFVRFDGRRVMSYSIVLEAAANGTTTAHNTQVVTALNEEGNRILDAEADDAFAFEMKVGEMLLNHFLTTGKKLPIAEAVEAVKLSGHR
jgi:hypothetical protein